MLWMGLAIPFQSLLASTTLPFFPSSARWQPIGTLRWRLSGCETASGPVARCVRGVRTASRPSFDVIGIVRIGCRCDLAGQVGCRFVELPGDFLVRGGGTAPADRASGGPGSDVPLRTADARTECRSGSPRSAAGTAAQDRRRVRRCGCNQGQGADALTQARELVNSAEQMVRWNMLFQIESVEQRRLATASYDRFSRVFQRNRVESSLRPEQ